MAIYRPDPELLRRQISSLRDQTERGWRCHVGIDGPDAATAKLLRELVADDERFILYEFPDNVGFYRNFERLLGAVDPASPWVALADQDDYWYPEKIERLLLPTWSLFSIDATSKLDSVFFSVTARARGLNREATRELSSG